MSWTHQYIADRTDRTDRDGLVVVVGKHDIEGVIGGFST
jgi:hypothetical protein